MCSYSIKTKYWTNTKPNPNPNPIYTSLSSLSSLNGFLIILYINYI